MNEPVTQAQIEWAHTYDGYRRLAHSPEALWDLVATAERELHSNGRVPDWCGVDFLRGWAFYMVRGDRHSGGGTLGRDWLAVLEAIANHPDAKPDDLPPGVRAKARPSEVPAQATSPKGNLELGHLLQSVGITELRDVIALRHTIRLKDPTSLRDLSPEGVLSYTRKQTVRTNILPKDPPPLWLIFVAEGDQGTRSRFYTAYDNRGELLEDRTEEFRCYDLHSSPIMEALRNRLVVDWGAGAIGWAKRGAKAAALPVVEIADPTVVPFPGFGGVLLTFDELRKVVADRWYAPWRAALSAVQGIYTISDSRTGQLYVGKADGSERILGRWTTYAQDGHGGNVALKALGVKDPSHKHDFVFSILRVFDPSVPASEVNAAESHFKQALLTRQFGLNRN